MGANKKAKGMFSTSLAFFYSIYLFLFFQEDHRYTGIQRNQIKLACITI